MRITLNCQLYLSELFIFLLFVNLEVLETFKQMSLLDMIILCFRL